MKIIMLTVMMIVVSTDCPEELYGQINGKGEARRGTNSTQTRRLRLVVRTMFQYCHYLNPFNSSSISVLPFGHLYRWLLCIV